MRYRLTSLTPLLVGDGNRLSPIDYMVWRDQVNVLDQRRIFRLLSKGPRLENYLGQLKRADKLDFASWGGFAQNFAGRRIPFEHPSSSQYWERARAEHLFIPTFACGPGGAFLPGSAIRGALRTGLVASRWTEATLREVATRLQGERPPRRPAEAAEDHAVGGPGVSWMKSIGVGDSAAVPFSSFRVYLLRVATLQSRGGGYELGWKLSPRGAVDGRRAAESTPIFAEMAVPGTVFEGPWRERDFYFRAEVLRALGWKEAPRTDALLEAANRYAGSVLALQRLYAEQAGLRLVAEAVAGLEARLVEARQGGRSCLLPLGWGGGLLTKAAWPDTTREPFRQVLRLIPLYARAVQTGLPFPKTRRIVFLADQPATLPGWTHLEVLA